METNNLSTRKPHDELTKLFKAPFVKMFENTNAMKIR